MELKYQLEGHQGPLYAICEGSSQRKLLSGGSDRKVVEWDLESGEGKLIANSAAAVMSMLYLKKEGLLLIGQAEGGIHCIDLAAKQEVKYLKGHESYLFDMKYLSARNEVIVSSADGTFSVWSTKSWERLYHRRISTEKLRKMDMNEAAGELLISSADGKITIIDLADYREKGVISAQHGFNVARFSRDANYLLAGDKEAHLSKIERESLEVLKRIPAHYWGIYDLAFSKDGKYFVTASRDKIIKLWDSERLEVLHRIEGLKMQGHTHSVNALKWLDELGLICSCGDDSKIKVWKFNS